MAAKLLDRVWTAIARRDCGSARPFDRGDLETCAAKLAAALLSGQSETARAARAKALIALYRALTPEQRHRFHLYLAGNFLPEPARLRAAAEAYLSRPTPATAAELTAVSLPVRQELLARLNAAPGGTSLLVAMREALIQAAREAPELKPLEQDLDRLLASWFNRGFLELRRIDWNTSAAILEKLILYEAVHEIRGWDDLRRRLAPDRRCFAFFHPALPGEPLIFIEVALCQGLPAEIGPLIAPAAPPQDAGHADTAVFYSISKCQPGLRGIPFGNFLIGHVVEELGAELPRLKCFATLSPIPGFRRWLDRRLASGDETLLEQGERAALGEPALGRFAEALAHRDWQRAQPAAPVLEPILQRLCALYLTAANGGRGPDDPVARFHLSNGARLERIDWRADASARRIAESYGLMANYRYELRASEANCEKFARGEVVYSAAVAALLRDRAKAVPARAPADAPQ